MQSELIKLRVCLSDVTADSWTPEHILQLTNYVRDPSQQLLVIYNDPQRGLQLAESFPTTLVKELTYFIRVAPETLTSDNFLDVVQYGTLFPDHVACLLRLMHDIYGPTFFVNTSWPDSILH